MRRTVRVVIDGVATPLRTSRGQRYAAGDPSAPGVPWHVCDEEGAAWCTVDVRAEPGVPVVVELSAPRSGPKPRPSSDVRGVALRVCLTPAEAEAARAAAGGRPVGAWLRELALREMRL